MKVLSTDVLQDENGTAVVVRLRNTGKPRAGAGAGRDRRARRAAASPLFRNDAPGLEPSLVRVPLLRPGEEFVWVNDQVAAAGEPARVKAKVGRRRRPCAPKRCRA